MFSLYKPFSISRNFGSGSAFKKLIVDFTLSTTPKYAPASRVGEQQPLPWLIKFAMMDCISAEG